MPIDESPPPYSAGVAAPEYVHIPELLDTTRPRNGLLESLNEALPFAHSDRLAAKIRALASEGNILCSRFKDFHEVASAHVEFEYQVPAFILSQVRRF